MAIYMGVGGWILSGEAATAFMVGGMALLAALGYYLSEDFSNVNSGSSTGTFIVE